jgi:hypothetical protein
LVFQVPKGITDYDLKYIGSGDYQFIYGKLAEPPAPPQEAPKPKLPWRNVTYNLKEDKVKTLLSPSIISQNGTIVQSSGFDLGDNGYANIEVKTFQEAINKDQALKDALKIERMHDFNTNEKGSYEATLANGDSITVHERANAAMPTNHGEFVVVAFMPNNKTMVKITSTLNRIRLQALLGSLKIEEPKSG